MEPVVILAGVDVELSKVKQESKRLELLAVLDNPEASHIDRLDLARFLLSVARYDVGAVCDIIHALNHWGDYSTNMTYNQVMSVARWLNRGITGQQNNNNISNVASFAPFLHFNEEKVSRSPVFKLCVIGSTRITCYDKRGCYLCKLKVASE
jgi:hypothetical protein